MSCTAVLRQHLSTEAKDNNKKNGQGITSMNNFYKTENQTTFRFDWKSKRYVYPQRIWTRIAISDQKFRHSGWSGRAGNAHQIKTHFYDGSMMHSKSDWLSSARWWGTTHLTSAKLSKRYGGSSRLKRVKNHGPSSWSSAPTLIVMAASLGSINTAYRHCCFHSLCVCLSIRRDEGPEVLCMNSAQFPAETLGRAAAITRPGVDQKVHYFKVHYLQVRYNWRIQLLQKTFLDLLKTCFF